VCGPFVSLNIIQNGYADTNATHNNNAATPSSGFNSKIYLEKFTGLPANQLIKKFYLSSTAGTNPYARIKLYQDDGAWQYNKFNGSNTAGFDGAVWVTKFTGLPVGNTITGLSLDITGGVCPSERVKIYQDDGAGGDPSTLLGESGPYTSAGTGINNINVTATIPTSGNVWAGFETTGASCAFEYLAVAPSGSTKSVAHAYGAGPSPFGAVTNHSYGIWMVLNYQSVSGGFPGTILNQTGSTKITSTGIFGFDIRASIPASGNIYAGFETNTTTLTLNYSALAFGTTYTSQPNPHTYGPGPTPFLFPQNTTINHWMRILYGSQPIISSGFTIKGFVLSSSAVFNNQNITITSPSTANVTALLLWNTNGQLVASCTVGAPNCGGLPTILNANVKTTIPITLADTTPRLSGAQSYYEQAIIQSSGGGLQTITSNTVTLNLGTFTAGTLNFTNQTNTNVIPIYFIRSGQGLPNSTDTRLSVIYPNSMNNTLKCNLAYVFAFTNKTYGPPLSSATFDPQNRNSSFRFHNIQHEIVNVLCTDTVTNTTGKYVLTQNRLPLQDQVDQFRNGTFGTHGQLGILDFLSVVGVILSMIGFNRINETVGVFFAVAIQGALAFFGIIQLPTFIFSALIVTAMMIVLSTRKSNVNF